MSTHKEGFDTLVVVCCHAIWLGGTTNGANESEWLIEPFQVGETPTFIEHIRAGVEILLNNSRAILVFSGGATKQDKTDLTEAEGYHRITIANNHFRFDNNQHQSSGISVKDRIFEERFATDSYQNILFSLFQFPLFVQRYQEVSTSSHDYSNGAKRSAIEDQLCTRFPSKLVIISHEFKRSRFLDLHLPAIKWSRYTEYIGINPPFDPIKLAEIEEGDQKRGYGAWKDDLYGNGRMLAHKRVSRGYDEDEFKHNVLNYLPEAVGDTAAKLLAWNGRDKANLFPELLPWEGRD